MGLERFICKNAITDNPIEIPANAQYLRLRKGYALFYMEKSEGINNGFIRIPEDFTKIAFPEYRRHCYHIDYGHPSFQK